jgi:hypothetical protein
MEESLSWGELEVAFKKEKMGEDLVESQAMRTVWKR